MNASTLILATRSVGKVREIRPIFAAVGLTLLAPDEFGIEESDAEDDLESFPTFEENALSKARYFFELSGGVPTIADDSGLEVDVLGGRPGVLSKRWSGRTDLRGADLDAANNAMLLAATDGHDQPAARYVCAAAFRDVGREIVTRGETPGHIVHTPSGTGGFGYDPLFFSSELGRTFGESSLVEKQRVSHRGRAFRQLLVAIAEGR